MFYEPCFRKMADYTATGFTSPMFPSSPFIGTTFPTGAPLGPHYAPLPAPTMPGNIPAPPQPAPPAQFPTPQTIQSTYYTAGFLKTQIGKRMRVEFLIGTNGALVDRTGTLVGVGTSYILLQPDGTNITILADLYSIKFVTIYPGGEAIV